MNKPEPCHNDAHDWMEWGSKRICVRCDKAEKRRDLPDWDYRQNGSIVRESSEPPTAKPTRRSPSPNRC